MPKAAAVLEFAIHPVPVPADVRNSPLVGAPLPWPEFLLSTFRDCPGNATPAVESHWLCALGAAGGGARKSDQGGALRLQDVWSVCAECHRHVMSDELSEESPKR